MPRFGHINAARTGRRLVFRPAATCGHVQLGKADCTHSLSQSWLFLFRLLENQTLWPLLTGHMRTRPHSLTNILIPNALDIHWLRIRALKS